MEVMKMPAKKGSKAKKTLTKKSMKSVKGGALLKYSLKLT
jgi:hypothetical protein